jgi:hypothetical protein
MTSIEIFRRMLPQPEKVPMTPQQEADLLLAQHQAERREKEQFERDLEVIRRVLGRK